MSLVPQHLSLPLVSIVTPSYNDSAIIERTILSVANQGYDKLEHLIIDGGSTDGTIQILQRYPHLKWISEKDDGQADALNKGFRMAKGEIIGWLNSDDTYNLGAIREAVSYLATHAQVGMVYSHCSVIDEKDAIIGRLNAPSFDLRR